MKYIIILFMVGIGFFVVANAEMLSVAEKNEIKLLNCQTTNDVFKSGRLVLGDSVGQKRQQVFLLKNITQKNIYIDFPEGHVGATAGLTQMLEPGQWDGYIYLKDKGDEHPVVTKGDKLIKKRMRWTCSYDDTKSIDCKLVLFVCEINYDQAKLAQSNSINDYNLLQILNRADHTWWIGDPAKDIVTLLGKTY